MIRLTAVIVALLWATFFLFANHALATAPVPADDPDRPPVTEEVRPAEAEPAWLVQTQLTPSDGPVQLCPARDINGDLVYKVVGGSVFGTVPGDPTLLNVFGGVFNMTVDGAKELTYCADVATPFNENLCAVGGPDGNGFHLMVPPNNAAKIACVLEAYPPQSSLDLFEAAARQAAVWHYTNGFVVTVRPADGEPGNSQAFKDRVDAIIADIEARYAAGTCAVTKRPVLTINPTAAMNQLEVEGNGFKQSSHAITLTLTLTDVVTNVETPLAGQVITVSTDVGTLNGSGSPITVPTGIDGMVVVTVSHNAPVTATITAQTTYGMRIAIEIVPPAGVDNQKVVLYATDPVTLVAKAINIWTNPTAVELLNFVAAWSNDAAVIKWDTGLEINSWGFHIERSDTGLRQDARRVTTALIPAVGNNGQYTFHDPAGKQWSRYWLIEVELDGTTLAYGPIEVKRIHTQAQAGKVLYLPIVASRSSGARAQ